MAFPNYVPVRTVSVGGATSIEDAAMLLKVRVKIEASRSLIWTATGYRLEQTTGFFESAVGQEASFPLPRTDVNGWKDAATGGAIEVTAPDMYTHRYTATITFVTEAGKQVGGQYTVGPFSLPDGVGTVDLDTMIPADAVPGGVVSIPDSWSQKVIAAEAAATSAAASMLDSDAFIAEQITTPGTQTETVLKTTIGEATAGVVTAELRKAGSLGQFWAKLQKGTEPVNILAVGTSISEGSLASSTELRWLARFRDKLRASYQQNGAVGGEGYVPAYYATNAFADRFGGNTGSNIGLGRRSTQIRADDPTRSGSFSGTGVDVLWTATTGSGSFSITIDGGTPLVVTHAGQAVAEGGQITPVRGLTNGAHTIVLQHISGGIWFEGIMPYNGDETSGIRVWDGGHATYTSADILAEGLTLPYDPVATINPDLITLEVGANDYTITAAALKANTIAIISRLRQYAAPTTPVALLGVWSRPSATDQAKWVSMFAALREIADEIPNVLFVDLQAKFGTNAEAFAAGLLADVVHPSDTGAELIAQTLMDAVGVISYTPPTAAPSDGDSGHRPGDPASGVVLTDTFTRQAAEIVGTKTDSGQTWIGTPGTWQLFGGRAKSIAASLLSPALVRAPAKGDMQMSFIYRTSTQETASRIDRILVKAVSSSNAVRLQRTGQNTAYWKIVALINNVERDLAPSTAVAIPPNTPATDYEFWLSVVGETVTAVINGVTLTGTLTTDEVNALQSGTGVAFSTNSPFSEIKSLVVSVEGIYV